MENFNQTEAIEQIMDIVKSIKDVQDYYVYDNELIIVFIDEIMIYDFEIIAYHLKIEMPLIEYISDIGDMRVSVRETCRTMILPLKEQFSENFTTL